MYFDPIYFFIMLSYKILGDSNYYRHSIYKGKILNNEGALAFTKSVQKPISEASPLSKFLINNFDRNTMMNLPMNIAIVELIVGKMTKLYNDLGCLCYFIKKYNIPPELGNIRWLCLFPKKEIKKAVENGLVEAHTCSKKVEQIKTNEQIMSSYYTLTEEAYKKYSKMDTNHSLEEKLLIQYKDQADDIGKKINWKRFDTEEFSKLLNYNFLSWAIYYVYENYSLREKEEMETYNVYFE